MAIALVGTIGAVSTGASGAAVTPSWGTSETRVAGHLLLCWVGGEGAATLPTTPGGWTVAAQKAGTSSSATLFSKIATGSDSAPTIALATSVIWNVQLAEYSGNDNSATPDKSATASGTTSPIVATDGSADSNPGNLVVGVAEIFYSAAASKTLTHTLNNGATPTATDNHATSTANHYSFCYGLTTGNSSASSDSFAFTTTNITGAALAFATFRAQQSRTATDTALATDSVTARLIHEQVTATDTATATDSAARKILESVTASDTALATNGSAPGPSYDSLLTGYTLYARWKCNDSSGTNVADSSGNSVTGTTHGTVTLGTADAPVGVPGTTCALLDGSTGYIQAGLATSAYTNVTLLGWVKITGNTGGPLLYLGTATSGNGYGMGIGGIGGNCWENYNYNTYVTGLEAALEWMNSSTKVGLNGWHMVALVYDSLGHPTLSLDSVTVYSDTTFQPVTPALKSLIGWDADNGGYLGGKVCEIAAINGNLTTANLLALYNAGTTVSASTDPRTLVVGRTASDTALTTDSATSGLVPVPITRATGFPVETGSGSFVTTQAATWQTVGDWAIVCVNLNYTGAQPSVATVSGTKTGTFVKLGGYVDTIASPYHDLEFWAAPVTSTGADTVTLSYSGSCTYCDVVVDEFHSPLASPQWGVVSIQGSHTSQSGTTAQLFNFPSITSGAALRQAYVGYSAASGIASAGSTSGFTYTILPSSANPWVFDGGAAVNTAYQPSAYNTDSGGSPIERSIGLIFTDSGIFTRTASDTALATDGPYQSGSPVKTTLSGSGPWSLCRALDGNVWVADITSGGGLWRVTPGGVATQFAKSGVTLYGVVLGADGNLWATDNGGAQVWKYVIGSNTWTSYALTGAPGGTASPFGIALGSDNRVWITDSTSGNGVWAVDTSGTVTNYPISGTSTVWPCLGTDGNMWVGGGASGYFIKVTPAGTVTKYGPLTGATYYNVSTPTVGADGNFWITNYGNGSAGTGGVWVVNTAGTQLNYFTDLGASSIAIGATLGPDLRVWVGDATSGDGVYSIGGNGSSFSVPMASATAYNSVIGSDGNL